MIDNYGDLGVCWRLCADLATHGQKVRLWVDDASALAWMDPAKSTNVEVHQWQEAAQASHFGDVVIEAFGCDLPNAVMQRIAERAQTIWINLEYLSAEDYVGKSHGLPSPIMQGPAKGLTKWFYYPGFNTNTGGLIREHDLRERRSTFNAQEWLKSIGIEHPIGPDETLISLFCYEPSALNQLISQLRQSNSPIRLLVTQGRAREALLKALPSQSDGNLRISQLPYLSQTDFDHLLWACDLNFVRGEDSVVRALWAEKPFVWQIYPQDDLAHHAKLQAFEEAIEMPEELRKYHAIWNGLQNDALPKLNHKILDEWRAWASQTSQSLQHQKDLTCQLMSFVKQKR